RNQNEKREHPEKDKRPFERVFDDGAKLERLVEPRVSQQVQAAVEEREQPERPPELDQPRKAQRLSERRDGQRETQEDQRQRSRRVKNECLLVRAQLVMVSVPAQQGARNSAVDEDQELGKFDVRHKLVVGGWWLVVGGWSLAADCANHQPPTTNHHLKIHLQI